MPRQVIEVNSFGTSWSLIARSDVLLVAPADMLHLAPCGEAIERVPLDIELPPLQIGLLTLRGISLSLAAERLAEQFRRFIALAQRR